MAEQATAITTPAPDTTSTSPAPYMDARSHRAEIMGEIAASMQADGTSATGEVQGQGTDVAGTPPVTDQAAQGESAPPPPAQTSPAPPDPVAALAAQVSALTGLVERFVGAQSAPAPAPTAPATPPAPVVDPDIAAMRQVLGGEHVPEYLASEEHQRRQRLVQWRAYEARATDDKEKAKAAAQVAELERQGQRIKHEVERERRLAEAEQKLKQQAEAPEREQEVAQRVERAKTVLTAEKVTSVYPQLGAAMAAGHVDLGAAFDNLAKSGALAGSPAEYGQTIDAVLALLNAAIKQPTAAATTQTPALVKKPADPGSAAPVTGPGVTASAEPTEYLSHRDLKAQSLRVALGTV